MFVLIGVLNCGIRFSSVFTVICFVVFVMAVDCFGCHRDGREYGVLI